ncbi:Conserved_hypothetical protein [Hexamita inflata]|uniref:Uncharacterized protein n=1 Tax=Hexamita inflata TaxID=28002 RepID=A0AA86TJM5_9EUKA|nr:Conserved hypothetical protein [Hexamita inflata]
MLHVTPMKLFNKAYLDVQQKLIKNLSVSYNQLEGFKMMHRSTHICSGKDVTAFSSFIPSYLIKYCITKETRKYAESLNKLIGYPLIANSCNSYQESIIITFLASQPDNLKKILYYAATQAIFKQLPLVIPKSVTILDISQYLNNVQLIQNSYYVIFPQHLDQLILSEPTKAGPILSKSGVLLHPVIADTPSEMQICSLIIRESFINDPPSCVYQPDVAKRKSFIQDLSYAIANDTLDRGTNFLMCEYNQKYISAQPAGVCALTSPPGSTDRFFGKDLSIAAVMLKHLGTNMFKINNPLVECHDKYCGQVDNHAYVAFFGSTIQNKGLGDAALQILEDIAEQVNADLYLENSNSNNLNFYKRRGLVVLEELNFTHDDRSAKCYAMRKDGKKDE